MEFETSMFELIWRFDIVDIHISICEYPMTGISVYDLFDISDTY